MRYWMRGAALAACLSLAGTAQAQPAAETAPAQAYLVPVTANPDLQLVEGTTTWQLLDFGGGPAAVALIAFPDIGADAMFVLQPSATPGFAHDFAFTLAFPAGDVPGPVTDGRLLETSAGLGIAASNRVIPFEQEVLGNAGQLVFAGAERNMQLFAAANALCGAIVDYAWMCFVIDPAGRAALDAVLAVPTSGLATVTYARGAFTAGADVPVAAFQGWVVPAAGSPAAPLAVRVRGRTVALDLTLAFDAEGAVLAVAPPPGVAGTPVPPLAGLTADTAIPDGVTIAELPEGLRLSGDPTAIGIWLGGQEALTLAMAGADGAAATLRLDLTNEIRTLIRAAVGIELP